jgi:hypothetical protein
MGCAALSSSKGASKPESSDEKDATVTESSVSNPPVATASLLTTTSPAASSSPGLKKDDRIKDADDDDDEIEIIYEEGPKKVPKATEDPLEKQMASAANAQEPPDAVEADMRPKKPVQAFGFDKPLESAPPLSKAQQEEAAKLAERRQKFDNQRYQKEGASAGGQGYQRDAAAGQGHQRDAAGGQGYQRDAAKFNNPDMPTVRSSDDILQDSGRTSPPAMKFNKPKDHGMILGLNQGQGGGYQNSQPDAFAGLPGGIFDDMEPLNRVPAKSTKMNRHDSFDAEEEQLMREILEDHDGKYMGGGLICDDF